MMYIFDPTSSLISAYDSYHALTPITPPIYQGGAFTQYGGTLTTSPSTPPYTSMLPEMFRHTILPENHYAPRAWHSSIVPVRFKVYFLPDGKTLPKWSIVHIQKRQDGFFRHPVLVVGVDDKYVHFYSMTRRPPQAIADMRMCFKVGSSNQEEGSETLRLETGSQRMQHETWINLEQRFKIEKHLLQHWQQNVIIAESERGKFCSKVDYLEAQQNRFIYKPIARDMSQVRIGTIILMPNPGSSTTFGAPVIVLENRYPQFRFLRVKSMATSAIFWEPLSPHFAQARRNCLAITPRLQYGHDATPVLILEPWSQDLREKSYVEIDRKQKWGSLDQCQTWCWPPVVVQAHSIKVLYDYIARLPPPTTGLDVPMPNQYHETQILRYRKSVTNGHAGPNNVGSYNADGRLDTYSMYGDLYGNSSMHPDDQHFQPNSGPPRESSTEPTQSYVKGHSTN